MKLITTLPGPEDMVLDQVHDRIIVSCCQRRKSDGDRKNEERAGYGFINPPDATFQRFAIAGLPPLACLRPHGIDISIENGESYLYSVSHCDLDGRDQSIILKFRISPDTLTYVGTYQNPHFLISPNDIAVTGAGKFYVTNDSTRSSRLGRFLDQALNLKSSNVVFHRNGSWQVVLDSLPFANGIASRGGQLFLTMTYQSSLHVYTALESGRLELAGRISCSRGMDNITFTEDGRLVVAAHTDLFKFARYAVGLAKVSPGAVFLLDPSSEQVSTLFRDPGNIISACSTGLIHKGKLYLSQVFKGQVLALDLQL